VTRYRNWLMLHRVSQRRTEQGRGKAAPVLAQVHPDASRRLRLPGFLDNRHVNVVRLSALRTGRLYPQGTSLVLIFVRG
jgi:hypothetical protein